MSFRKTVPGGPARYTEWETLGLDWLRVDGGAPVVRVLDVGRHHLELEALTEAAPTAEAAREFGRRLAVTHDAGAAAFGAAPDGWTGDGFLGPASEPLPLLLRPHDTWGEFYARDRIEPFVRTLRDGGLLDADDAALLDQVAQRCAAGEFDTADGPSRIHGDLWAGNLMWTPAGATLIDPAAHGGHREADLAMLALFGTPHLEDVVAGYADQHPPADGWRDRVGLHQLHPVLLHAQLFGAGYARQAVDLARRYR